MKSIILTGSTSGIGKAVARVVLESGNRVIGIARSENPFSNESNYFHVRQDLSSVQNMEDSFLEAIEKAKSSEEIFLVLNAGTIDPMKPIEQAGSTEIRMAVHLNLTSVLIFASLFIRELSEFKGRKRILSVSSGAAKKAYPGWTVYGATKAAVESLTRNIAAEQSGREYPVEIVSLAPGVVDTPMQSLIRETSEAEFPMKSRFVSLKKEGALKTPEEAAEGILRVLFSQEYPSGSVLDIRELG